MYVYVLAFRANTRKFFFANTRQDVFPNTQSGRRAPLCWRSGCPQTHASHARPPYRKHLGARLALGMFAKMIF